MNFLKYVVKFLIVIAALNLGIIGAFNYDLLGTLLGGMMLLRIVYCLIGLAGLAGLVCLVKHCNCGCNSGNKKDKGHGGGCCR